MPNLVNEMVVRELDSGLANAGGLLLLNVAGLTVKETEALRRDLAAKKLRLRFVRSRLARLAFTRKGLAFSEEACAGSLGLICGSGEDAINAAKVLKGSDLLKNKRLSVRAGMLEGAVLGQADTLALAEVPDRATLQAKLLGCLSGPARGLVTLLNANPSGLARVIQARADKAPADGAAPAAS